jgi:hypothetical protein
MIGGLFLALLLAAQPTDLERFREILVASWWTNCCAFPSGVPEDIERRIEIVQAALERRFGSAATAAVVTAARAEFSEEFGVYDPVARRFTPRQLQRERRTIWRWYDARLDAIEARLGLAAR